MGLFDAFAKKIEIGSVETVLDWLEKMKQEFSSDMKLCEKGEYKKASLSSQSNYPWREQQKLFIVKSKEVWKDDNHHLPFERLILTQNKETKEISFTMALPDDVYQSLVLFKQKDGASIINLAHSMGCLDKKKVEIVSYDEDLEMFFGNNLGYLPKNLRHLVAYEYINYYADKIGCSVALSELDILNFYCLWADEESDSYDPKFYDRIYSYREHNFSKLLALLGFDFGETIEETKPDIIDAIKNYKRNRDEIDNEGDDNDNEE